MNMIKYDIELTKYELEKLKGIQKGIERVRNVAIMVLSLCFFALVVLYVLKPC